MNRRKTRIARDEVEGMITMLDQSGVGIREGAGESLVRLDGLIRKWNERVNLISRKDISRLVSYHFCDAASLLPVIKPEASINLLDLGGSNGLPGLVLAALSPNIQVTVCDSRQKRKGFMDEACAAIGKSASHVIARVDSDTYRTANMERFDIIVARAVTRLKLLLKWCLPLLRPGGYIAAYKGSRCVEEVKQAESYLWAHGGNLVMVLGSPFSSKCNPMRQFAIVGKSR